ncbi:MAG TPA: tRNA-dihydrouridine synthase [Planctomycetota bacterium]|nr:tRNA-dihydrouridine synthase [Planctomycetota bacterium]
MTQTAPEPTAPVLPPAAADSAGLGTNTGLCHPLQVGSVRLETNLLMPPIAGFSNLFTRNMVRSFGGCGCVAAEMIAADSVLHNPAPPRRLFGCEFEARPLEIQMFDDDADSLLKAATKIVDQFHPSILDINFGCPASCVVDNHAGSYLLSEPAKVGRFVRTLARNLPVPVTAKIRLGCSPDNITALAVAKEVEQAGGALLSVHGRTAKQMYSGTADWDWIARIKQSISIPVLGNGDLDSPQTIERRLRESGVDGVLIARAALKKPWIFRDTWHHLNGRDIPPPPSLRELCDFLIEHLRFLTKATSEHDAVVTVRLHAMRLLAERPGAKLFRGRSSDTKTAAAFELLLNEFAAGVMTREGPDI